MPTKKATSQAGLASKLEQFLDRVSAAERDEQPLAWICDRYLAHLATRRKPSYVHGLRSELPRVLAAMGGEQPRHLTVELAERYIGRRTADGVSNRTIAKEISAASTMLDWAVERSYACCNGLAGVRPLPQGKAYQTRRRRALDESECDRLIVAADQVDELGAAAGPRVPQAPFYLALIETGSRWGDVARAVWADLLPGVPAIRFWAANNKTGRERVIPIRPGLLERLQASRDAQAAVLGHRPAQADLMFPAPRGGAQRHAGTSKQLHRLLKAAGIQRVNARGERVDFYSLRYAACTRLQRAGFPVTIAQAFLGHSTSKLTADIYTQFDVADLAAAVAALPELGHNGRESIAPEDPSDPDSGDQEGGGGTRNRTGDDGFASHDPSPHIVELPVGRAVESISALLREIAASVEAGRVVVLRRGADS